MTDGEGNPVSRDIIDDCLRAIPQEDSRPYDWIMFWVIISYIFFIYKKLY